MEFLPAGPSLHRAHVRLAGDEHVLTEAHVMENTEVRHLRRISALPPAHRTLPPLPIRLRVKLL